MSISALITLFTGFVEIDLATISAAHSGDQITIGNKMYTAVTGTPSTDQFEVGGTGGTDGDAGTAVSLAAAILIDPPTGLLGASVTNPFAPQAPAQASVFVQGPFGSTQVSGTIRGGNTGTWTISAMAQPGTQVSVDCAVSSSAAVNVTALTPSVVPTPTPSDPAPVNQGVPPLFFGQPTAVPASGTSHFAWQDVPSSPQCGATPNNAQTPPTSQSYTVGATIVTSDNSTTLATSANLIVYPPLYNVGGGIF